tara:strand:- start:1059 stop:2033 length:975 start_codon:yes stop_codon:yes gene_type:complete
MQRDYQTGLLLVIDQYITKNENTILKKSGLLCAKQLKQLVVGHLLSVEGLSERQLMWRMCDYVAMSHGSGPLSASKMLREAILRHMCDYLNISENTQEEAEALMLKEDRQIISMSYLPVGMYQEDCHASEIRARLYLAREKLMKAHVAKDVVSETTLFSQLSSTINVYQAAKQQQWFASTDVRRAARLRNQISSQWMGVEKLNDHQILCRLCEHLSMPVGAGQGLFGPSNGLRRSVSELMCQLLGVDMHAPQQERHHDIVVPLFPASNFGPIYQVPYGEPDEVAMRVSRINRKLIALVTSGDYQVPIISSGDDIEMQNFSRSKC